MRTVILLHGLGANARVWDPLIEVVEREGGRRCIAPDLPGHGSAARLGSYSPASMAEALLSEIGDAADGAVVLGHSLGGVVGLAMAARAKVAAVTGLGIKVAWADEEVAGLAALAGKPAKVFEDEASAVERALKVAGLWGLIPPDHPAATAGVRRTDGGWTLAMDPAAKRGRRAGHAEPAG